FEVRFTLKNVTDKPIVICDYVGNRPLGVDWTGPDGKKRESPHYDWLKAVRLRPLSKENFVTIPPGGVVAVGLEIKGPGIAFPMAGSGKHKLTVRYTNKEDGKAFGLKDVWTGTVAAPEVTVTVK